MKNTFQGIGKVLSSPIKSFQSDGYHQASRALLIILLYALFLGSSLLSYKTQQTDTFKEISYNLSMDILENQMAGATEEQMEQARQTVRDQLNSPVQKIIQMVTLALTSGFFLVRVLMIWGVVNLLARFLGGEETPLDEKKHRRSFYMALYASLPVAISYLISGVLVVTKNPDSYAHVLTMEDYILAMEASPSLYYLFRPDGFDPGAFLKYLFTVLTDPFHWWGYAVLYGGLRGILRLDGKKAALICGLILLLLAGLTVLVQLPAKLVGG